MSTLGGRIRKLRKSSNVTLVELAQKAGVTPGYISQIERDITSPSIAALNRIAEAIGVRLGVFFDGVAEPSPAAPEAEPDDPPGLVGIVLRDQRKTLTFPLSNMLAELLCPDLRHSMEITLTKLPPGSSSGQSGVVHKGEECAIVLKGKVSFTFESKTYILQGGDTAYFEGNVRHSWMNVGDDEAQIIWVSAPPKF